MEQFENIWVQSSRSTLNEAKPNEGWLPVTAKIVDNKIGPICYYVYLFFPDHLVAAVFVLLVACCGIVSLLQSECSLLLPLNLLFLISIL